jgi:hypothetical protein
MRLRWPVVLSALLVVGRAACSSQSGVGSNSAAPTTSQTFEMRSVIATFPASTSNTSKVGPGPLPSDVNGTSDQSLPVNCALPAAPTLPSQQITACDELSQTVYVLGPAVITESDVAFAVATLPVQGVGGSTVEIKLTDAGTARFTAITTAAHNKAAPQNQIAIVIDTKVMSAPSVYAPIPGGSVQIADNFTQDQAQKIAEKIRS